VRKLNQGEKIEFIQLSPLFQNLTKRQLGFVAKSTYQETIEAGCPIIKQGSMGKEFFVIADGIARVEIDGKFVKNISQGAYFGEVSLLDGRPMSASILSETDVHLLCVNKTSFSNLLEQVPGFKDKLILGLCNYIRKSEVMIQKLKSTLDDSFGQFP